MDLMESRLTEERNERRIWQIAGPAIEVEVDDATARRAEPFVEVS
jgi:hypothetical protein